MPDPTNLALIGGVFGLLIGSIFSQRARCGLAYLVVPLLSAFALHRVWGTSFDLVEELTFTQQRRVESHGEGEQAVGCERPLHEAARQGLGRFHKAWYATGCTNL